MEVDIQFLKHQTTVTFVQEVVVPPHKVVLVWVQIGKFFKHGHLQTYEKMVNDR